MLFITHKYPPSIGGMETHCFELFKGISGKIDVVMMRLPETSSRVVWLMTLKKRVRRYLSEHPDITHVYFHDGLSGLVCQDIKTYSNVKTIVTLHGLDVVFPNALYQKKISENFSTSVDALIPVSTATGIECIKRGAPEEKVHVVPNGVDLTLKDIRRDRNFISALEKRLGIPLKNKKILVSIGRSVKRKGFSWFLKNVLPELNNDIIYIMIGPREENIKRKLALLHLLPKDISRQITLTGVGVDQVEIDSYVQAPDIKGRAFHLGKLPFDDLVQLLKNSYAFVMPNIPVVGDAEGFGLVALEAVMNGTAVLASDLEGITEAIHDGQNGILVKPGNPEDWKKQIEALCADPKARERLIKKAISYTEKNFSWDRMVSGYLKVFENTAQGRQ